MPHNNTKFKKYAIINYKNKKYLLILKFIHFTFIFNFFNGQVFFRLFTTYLEKQKILCANH